MRPAYNSHERWIKKDDGIWKNSYEDLMTMVDNAIVENIGLFGEDAVLFATHPAYAVVINESGKAFSVDYKVLDGKVKLGKKKELDIPVVTVEDIAKQTVDNFFSGNSIVEGMKGLIKTSFGKPSPMEQVQEDLNRLFADGLIWREFVSDYSVKMAQFAFDPKYGLPKNKIVPKFESLTNGSVEESELENGKDEVVVSLSEVDDYLKSLSASIHEAYENYKDKSDGIGDDESAVLSHFELFSEDYLEYLDAIKDFVSESVNNSDSSCAACLALIHDEVAERVKNLELGGRLIRKVSAEL